MEETFKTKLLSASLFHVHAQPKNVKSKFNIVFLCSPPHHISFQHISHNQAATVIRVPLDRRASIGTDSQWVHGPTVCLLHTRSLSEAERGGGPTLSS